MRQPNPIAQGMALQILVVVAITIGMIVVATGAGQAQTLTVLHTFASGSNGANPISGLTRDAAGNLYGTTEFGGAGCLNSGCGLVYKVTHHGSAWLETTLYTFTGAPDAAFPVGRVVFGPDGALYGTTRGGGSDSCSGGCGTVFKLQPPPRACGSLLCPWRETILYSFTSPADGAFPQGEVAFDQSGNLYGTTEGGGAGPCRESEYPGCGTVFKLTHNPDGSWSKSTLYSFQGGATDGQFPLAAVVLDQAGNLYGTTPTGGGTGCPDQNNEGCGIVFELSPSGSGWTESIPYDFTGGSDGAIPTAGLIVDSQGNLYGSALYGGQGSGTVFELTSGQGGWNFSV
ncbi:MAG: choice-of-anchor tandem repeat GloVer-containing protein, partial [Candidatus Korobacteraceae bacterium]